MIELKIPELTLSNNHSLFNTFSVSYFAYLKFYVAISCNCNVWLAIRHTLTCVHDVAFSKIIFVQLHNSTFCKQWNTLINLRIWYHSNTFKPHQMHWVANGFCFWKSEMSLEIWQWGTGKKCQFVIMVIILMIIYLVFKLSNPHAC